MKLLVEFAVYGYHPVPWTVPSISTRVVNGTTVRHVGRPQKHNLPEGRLTLKEWQSCIGDAARLAMAEAGCSLQINTPLKVDFVFYHETPLGCRHGQLWDIRIEWNKAKKRWSRRNRDGKSEPDLTNLVKGAEDAIQGIVCVDDCKHRIVTAVCLFGPLSGISVTVSRIDPEDYPGHGGIVT